MLNFNNVLTKQEGKNVTRQLFELYREKKSQTTEEGFYDVVTSVVWGMDITLDDHPMGNLDNDYEDYRFHVNLLNIQQVDEKMKGQVEYSYKQIDNEGEETGYEEMGYKKLTSHEASQLVEAIKDKIRSLE